LISNNPPQQKVREKDREVAFISLSRKKSHGAEDANSPLPTLTLFLFTESGNSREKKRSTCPFRSEGSPSRTLERMDLIRGVRGGKLRRDKGKFGLLLLTPKIPAGDESFFAS